MQNCFFIINGHSNPIMATGKNHSIRHTPGDVALYCDAINVSCDAPRTEEKITLVGSHIQ